MLYVIENVSIYVQFQCRTLLDLDIVFPFGVIRNVITPTQLLIKAMKQVNNKYYS